MPTPHSQPGTPVETHAASDDDLHHGGDQSPLNDADSDEDRDPEAELDLTELDLDGFADADKLDIGSANLS